MIFRIDGFTGNNDEYIAYLEHNVLLLRDQLACSSRIIPETSTPQRNVRQEAEPADVHGVELREAEVRDAESHEPPGVQEAERCEPPEIQESHNRDSARSRALNKNGLKHARCGLQIEHYDASQHLVKRTRFPASKVLSNQAPPWKSHADKLVETVPLKDSWKATMDSDGISDALSSGMAVKYILGQDTPLHHWSQITEATPSSYSSGSFSTMLERLSACAKLAASRNTDAYLVLMLTNFQTFVVLSACIVALDTGSIPKQDIYQIVRIAVGKNGDEVYCVRKLEAARYLNRLVDALVVKGWQGRAAELVLRCMAPLHLPSSTSLIRSLARESPLVILLPPFSCSSC